MSKSSTPISICIICKNEQKHIVTFLQSILKALANHTYEIVIVDTGSTDDTLQLINQTLKGTNYKLCHFDWIGDFAAARNYSLDQATNDWVLVLDCDEYIESLDTNCFSQMIDQFPTGVGLLERHNHQELNGIDSIYTDQVERLFNKKYYFYEAIIHEQVRVRPQFVGTTTSANTDIISEYSDRYSRISIPLIVDHCGYVGTPEEIKAKADRNINLLLEMLKKDPTDPYIYFQIGQSYNSIHDDENAAYYYGKGLEYDIDPEAEYAQMMIEAYGYSLLHLERYDEALQFENIIDVFGKTPEFAVLMGLIYLRKGMLLQAMTQFLQATTYDTCRTEGSNTFIPYFNMGCVNEVFGNKEDAIALYEKCGNFPQALDRLKELKQQ